MICEIKIQHIIITIYGVANMLQPITSIPKELLAFVQKKKNQGTQNHYHALYRLPTGIERYGMVPHHTGPIPDPQNL